MANSLAEPVTFAALLGVALRFPGGIALKWGFNVPKGQAPPMDTSL